MRVAFVAPRYHPLRGGVETHVEQIARRVAAAGHEVRVLTHAHGRGAPRSEEIDGVVVERFPRALALEHYGFAPGMRRSLSSTPFDVIHAHNYHALPALLAASAGVPLVFTPHYHGTSESRLRRGLHMAYRPLGARIFSRASQVICVSEAEAALVRADFPEVARRLSVIANGVDVEDLRASEPYAVDGTLILVVGRLERYKNVDRVIETMAHLAGDHVLRIIGDGAARPDLEARVRRAGLQDRVHFMREVDTPALRRWFRTADAFVSLSSLEAMGITVMEALAAGTPVVASDIPAYAEVATRSPGGVTLVRPGEDAAGLALAIQQAVGTDVRTGSIPTWDDAARATLSVLVAAAD